MARLLAPTARVARHAAGRPVSWPWASAMNAAAPSWRVATTLIPAASRPSSNPRKLSPGTVKALVDGCVNVMRYLKMMDGPPAMVESPVWIERIASITSDVNGIFYPLVTRGTYVQRGMKVGYVTDYLGKTVLEARAPESGVVLFVRAVPSMTKGETIANIGVPAR